jgi:hypothetical protein
MLLNGWKEIGAYLRSGTRTVQRWEKLGLPVTRIGSGRRGPVMAQSAALDAWLRHRSGRQPAMLLGDHTRIHDALGKAARLRQTAIDELRVLLRTELSIGIRMSKTALNSRSPAVAKRNTAMARQALDAVIRLSGRLSRDFPSKQFQSDINKLKSQLRQLGENL